MKKVIIALIIAMAITYLYTLYQDWVYYEIMANLVEKQISVEGAGVKVVVDDNTTWETVFKAIATVLATYFGIKVTNKVIK